jgi:hypothetical protein
MSFSKILKIGFSIIGICLVLIAGLFGWVYQYRHQLFQYIIKEANSNLNGTFSAEKLQFTPFSNHIGLSFTLFNVHLRDSAYAKHHVELLALQRLTVNVNLRALLQKKVQVNSVSFEQGKVAVFTDKNGYTNLRVFDKKDTTSQHNTSSSDFFRQILDNLPTIETEDLTVSWQDSLKEKHIDFVLKDITNESESTDNLINSRLKGKVDFGQLTFNPRRGGFLKNKSTDLDLRLTYHFERQQLQINPSSVMIAKDVFGLKGQFDFSNRGRVQLEITTDTIATQRALEILPQRLAQQIARHKVLPVVKAKVRLNGLLRGQNTPRVDIDFQTKTFDYKSPIGMLTQTLGSGHFTNQIDTTQAISDQNSRITAHQISGLLYGVIPTNFMFTVTNLDEPALVMEGNFKANLSRCNRLFDATQIQFKAGNALVSYCYKGKIDPIFDTKNNRLNGHLEGNLRLVGGAFVYVPRKMNFSRLNSFLRFDEKKADLTFFHFNHQKNQIRMSGQVTGLIPYAFGGTGKVQSNLSIFTPNLGLDWIRDYHSSAKKKAKKPFTEVLDKVLARLELKALLMAHKVQYRKFEAEKVEGRVFFAKQVVRCENVKMKAFGGDFLVNGGIELFDQPVHVLYAKGEVNNADVQKVFYAFENFGQSTLSEHNLIGTLSTHFSYKSELKRDFSILPNTMTGQLSFELSNGQLNHFGPLLRIQRVLFKRRNFQNVRFANLKNQFTLQGQEIYMGQMKVTSSVLTFFVEGTYSFRDKTDLLVQIPLSNLKRNPDEAASQSLDGNNLLIHAIDEKGEIRLKYDLDWRKKMRNER